MKIFRLLLLLGFAMPAVADIGDITGSATLTATCSNANTTCDTAGTTVFNFGSPFNVQGPQTIEVTTQGYGLVTVTASGTYAGSTLNFEFSDDGGTTWYSEQCTRTDANIQETSEATPTNAFRAWDCGVGAATKFRVRQSAIGSGGPVVKLTLTQGLVEPAPTMAVSTVLGNGCMNPTSTLNSSVVSLSGTTATQIAALVSGQKIFVCSLTLGNGSGTTPTFSLQYGTGSNCATGTATILPAIAIPTGTAAPLNFGQTFFATPASQALCYILTGTTPTGTLIVNYVQQ